LVDVGWRSGSLSSLSSLVIGLLVGLGTRWLVEVGCGSLASWCWLVAWMLGFGVLVLLCWVLRLSVSSGDWSWSSGAVSLVLDVSWS
jgi:hypothetical protein